MVYQSSKPVITMVNSAHTRSSEANGFLPSIETKAKSMQEASSTSNGGAVVRSGSNLRNFDNKIQ